jgi:PAS domain S-box-containing protein
MNADRKLTAAGDHPGDLPLIDIENLKLTDLIDTPAIQKLMEDFYELTGVPMSITDAEGKVLVGVGWQEICTRFHRVCPETRKFCLESDLLLTQDIQEGDFRLYKCKNHMWDAACPLVIDGRRMGYLFTGQFFFDDEIPDEPLFRIQAEQYGFDVDRYLAALRKVHRLNRDKVRRAMGFLHGLAKMISQDSCSRLKLARLCRQKNQSEQALRESGERLRRIAKAAGIGFFEWNASKDVSYWSPEHYDIFGYKPGEAITLERWLQGVHPEDRRRVTDNAARLLERGRAEGRLQGHKDQYRFIRDDGSVIWIEADTSLEMVDGEAIVGGSVRDITERKLAEETIRETNQRLQMALDGAYLISFEWDIERDQVRRFTSRDATLSPTEGQTYDTFEQVHQKVYPEDRDVFARNVHAALVHPQGRYENEYRVAHTDGTITWLDEQGMVERDATGKAVRLLGLARDITARKQAEQTLTGQRELLQGLFDNIPVLLVMWDPLLQRFTLNKCAESVLGWTTDDANDGDFMCKVYPDPDYRKKVCDYMQSLDPGWREWTCTAKNGQCIPIDWANISLSDHTMIGIGVDLTARKQAQEALRESDKLYRTLARNLPGGAAFILDQNLRYMLAGGQALEPAGFTPADFEGKTIWQALEKEVAEVYEPYFRQVLAGKPFHAEHTSHGRQYASEGIPIRDDKGTVTSILITSYDITDRKQAEEALRQSEERLRSAPGGDRGPVSQRARGPDACWIAICVSSANSERLARDQRNPGR